MDKISNPWSDYDVWNWTETDASELIYDGWANLPVDTYCWNASLYVISGTSLQYVDVEYGCFDVVASNNSGGGNNSQTTAVEEITLRKQYWRRK